MVMKGTVQPNHVPINNYELVVAGAPKLLFVTLTAPEVETEMVDLPDRTKASGGNELPSEAVGTTFEHHLTENEYLETWRREGVGNVAETYKRTATLIRRGINGEVVTTETWIRVSVSKKKKTDLDMANAGDPAMIEWTFQIDKIE